MKEGVDESLSKGNTELVMSRRMWPYLWFLDASTGTPVAAFAYSSIDSWGVPEPPNLSMPFTSAILIS